MELVTGRKGSPHVTSQQDRMLNQGIFGQGAYILNTGQNLEPQVQTSNEVRIRDGAIMAQGALGCVKVNTYDSVTIQNGNQGMKRTDLICWQYTYDAEQDAESASWVVVQGTPAESDPETPAYTEGNIQEGDSLVQIPVFAVHLDGINITGVDTLLSIALDMDEANKQLAELNGKLEDTGWINLGSNARYRKKSGIVTITGNSDGELSIPKFDGTITLGTLPVDCRPGDNILAVATSKASTGYLLQVRVFPTGQVSITNLNPNSAAAYWGFSLSYPV